MIENENIEHVSGRADVLIDRATRVVRLLAWLAMFALCCLMLWVVSGMAARAGDPKAAARELGQAANTAAGAIARNAGSTATVPGYAGTNVPERSLTASGMEDAARARLADPADPGGTAGRAVIEGVTTRPDRPVSGSDPAVVRGETIADNPQNAAHGADGLASGTVSACGSDLQDAGTGGSCGQVRYCVGAGCETVRPRSNTGFVEATTRLNMALELGGEAFDREDMRFFKGKRRACHIYFGGPGQLLQELRAAGRPRQLLGVGTRARRGAQRRQHPLSRQVLLEAHLLRHLHPPVAGLVPVRLQARAHPAGTGPGAARRGLGQLPGPHGRRDRVDRLRQPRPLRVHREPDGRLD